MSSTGCRKIGIVILNYKSYLDTEILVKELLSQETPHELIIQIVDNASPNESYTYLKDKLGNIPNVYIHANSENSGFAKGNNVGLRLLESFSPDYALVLNNDVHFDISLLDKLVTVYERIDDAGAMAPLQQYPSGEVDCKTLVLPGFLHDVLSYTYMFSKRQRCALTFKENCSHLAVRRVDVIPGCFVFISYDLFRNVGFFSEDTFLFCEERFLARKLKDAGRSSYLLLDCSFIHDHSKTINGEVALLKQLRMMHDGKLAYTRAYRHFPTVKVAVLRCMWAYQNCRIRTMAFLRRLFRSC